MIEKSWRVQIEILMFFLVKLETPADDEIETVEFNDSDTETIETNEASTSGQGLAVVSGSEFSQAAGKFSTLLRRPEKYIYLEKLKLFIISGIIYFSVLHA